MRVLITGFNSFAGIKTNPSQLIVERLHPQKFSTDIEVTKVVLPTEFSAAGDKLQQLITSISPQIILLLGVAAKRKVVSLERVALNLNDCSLPDNAGCKREGQIIIEQGPPAYFATLPLHDLQKELHKHAIATEISNHAGTYVCNHVFYLALHYIKQLQLNTACGFIHVPLVSDNSTSSMNLQKLIDAIGLSINFLHANVV